MLRLNERGRRVGGIAVKGLLFFSLIVGLQFLAGAYSSEFGLEPDEASHYITGLMVRDYIAAGLPSSPLHFAENYYLHYPRVAFGHYPPMFYLVQAPWTMIFGVSHASLMLLMAALTTILALLAESVISNRHGTAVGITLACMILLMPETQQAASTVMAESLLAVISFAALIYFARYLKGVRWRDAAGFTLFSTLAILTKGLALALAAVPPVAGLVSKRRRLFYRLSFWMPAVVVGAVCAPIYEFLPGTGIKTFSKTQGFYFAPSTISITPIWVMHQMGVIALILIVLGAYLWAHAAITGKPVDELETVTGALLIGFLVLRMFVYAAQEHRHDMMVAAPLLVFLAAGAEWAARRLRESAMLVSATTFLVLLPVIAMFLLTVFHVTRKPYYGLDRVASDLLAAKHPGEEVFLIASRGWEEGVFISEVAMRERRPGHYILRAYQVLVHRTSRDGSSMYFRTPEEIARYLDSVPVGVVVLSFPRAQLVEPTEFQALLEKTLDSKSDLWTKRAYPGGETNRSGERIVVYRRLVPLDASHPRIQIDMQRRLGRVLEN